MVTAWILIAIFLSTMLIYLFSDQSIRKMVKPWSAFVVAVTPTFIFVFSTGRLSEFGGLGLTLKLEREVQSAVGLGSDWTEVKGEQITPISRTTLGKVDELDECDKAPDLTWHWIKVGSDDLRNLSVQCILFYPPNSMLPGSSNAYMPGGVIINDRENRLFGVIFNRNGTLVARSEEAEKYLESGMLKYIKEIIRDHVAVTDTRVDALSIIRDSKLELLPVVDSDGEFRGFTDKGTVINSIVLGLIK